MMEEGVPIPRQHQLRQRASSEFKRFLVIFLYLWVVFGLLSIHKSLVLAQHRLDYPEHAFAIVNAFIFAKVLLIGEQFRLGTRFRDRPLIYPILHKCLIFTVVLICFHVAESVLVGVWHGHTIVNSFPPMFAGSVRGVLSVGVICFVVLLPFFGFREIGRVIGPNELWAVIFVDRNSESRVSLS